MSIKDKYIVRSIDKNQCYEWLLKKHYAKRIPSITYSFGLFDNKILLGCITFGMPPGSTICNSICGDKYSTIVLELNRLIINDGLDKNVLSYFVSKSLKLLPAPKIIISFSDKNKNHHGYIYQATNFKYTGETSNTKQFVNINGTEFHHRNIGHLQKSNKLNAKLIKRRKNDNRIDNIQIAEYLKKNKGNYTAKKLDLIFGYKNTAAHWFRTDDGFSFPNIDDWIKLKELFGFDNKYDRIMTEYDWIPCAKDIIKKLNLKEIKIYPKFRYIFFLGTKKEKKEMIKHLKYKFLPYPKGDNKRYDTSYKPETQIPLF